MTYDLILKQKLDKAVRSIDRDSFIEGLSSSHYRIFNFCISALSYEELENRIRKIEDDMKDALVYIVRPTDDTYDQLKAEFTIGDIPAIIITAIDKLASAEHEDYYQTAHFNIEGKRYLNSGDLLVRAIEQINKMFIDGKVAKCLREAKSSNRNIVMQELADLGNNTLDKEVLNNMDIIISVIDGRFEFRDQS